MSIVFCTDSNGTFMAVIFCLSTGTTSSQISQIFDRLKINCYQKFTSYPLGLMSSDDDLDLVHSFLHWMFSIFLSAREKRIVKVC